MSTAMIWASGIFAHPFWFIAFSIPFCLQTGEEQKKIWRNNVLHFIISNGKLYPQSDEYVQLLQNGRWIEGGFIVV